MFFRLFQHYTLILNNNLVVIVDNNGLQIDGNIADVNSPYPIDKKFEAFNFHVINIDGHDFDAIAAAFKEARETKGQPTAIIAKTIKGKDVSFMENQASWHGTAPNDEQFAIAMADLEKVGEAVNQNKKKERPTAPVSKATKSKERFKTHMKKRAKKEKK